SSTGTCPGSSPTSYLATVSTQPPSMTLETNQGRFLLKMVSLSTTLLLLSNQVVVLATTPPRLPQATSKRPLRVAWVTLPSVRTVIWGALGSALCHLLYALCN